MGHKCHRNHSNRIISSERSQHLHQKWVWLVCRRVLSTRAIVLPTYQDSGSVHGYSGTRCRSNVKGAYTDTENSEEKTDVVKLTFCCKFCVWFQIWPRLDDSDICGIKWRWKCPMNFRPPPSISPSSDLNMPKKLKPMLCQTMSVSESVSVSPDSAAEANTNTVTRRGN